MNAIKTYDITNEVVALRGQQNQGTFNSVSMSLKSTLKELMDKTGIKDPNWITFVLDGEPQK